MWIGANGSRSRRHEPGRPVFDGPDPTAFFVRATPVSLLQRRQPYDFVETYEVLTRLFGYRLPYVNLGYWLDGAATVEPGRELVREMARLLRLVPGATLLDVGSGLGQAAVDFCLEHGALRVQGINVNARQVAYANALARARGLEGRVSHIVGDASSDLGALGARSCDAVTAIECAGHFRDPLGFLSSARRLLRAGGRLALCLNVASGPLSLSQQLLYSLAFDCVPASLETWTDRLRATGYRDIQTFDWTSPVSRASIGFALGRLASGGTGLNPLVAAYTALQLRVAKRSIDSGALSYFAVLADARTEDRPDQDSKSRLASSLRRTPTSA
jgi:SAM-dependent methyltransferase